MMHPEMRFRIHFYFQLELYTISYFIIQRVYFLYSYINTIILFLVKKNKKQGAKKLAPLKERNVKIVCSFIYSTLKNSFQSYWKYYLFSMLFQITILFFCSRG
jgi:hypothetical protein